ncbi:hypothetical protein ACHAWF_010219 [Thalassiosira exigua]
MAVPSPPSRADSTATASTAASFSSARSSDGGGSSSSSPGPTALPTEEALQVLLSPDGYYKYLAIPKPEPDPLGPKYQAAMAAGGKDVGDGAGSGGGVDLDRVKKNYRRLSLRHHPDRRTGDAEAFRMLNRAKVVLSSSKLRREYDLVGLDLEDDADEEEHHEDGSGAGSSRENGEGDGGADEDKKDGDEGKSKTETVMGHLASATLAGVLQVVVRTGMMALASTLISRYTILAFLAIGMLALLSTKMYSALRKQLGPDVKITFSTMKDALSPMVIAFGLFMMYRGRRILASPAGDGETDVKAAGDSTAPGDASAEAYLEWTWTFLFGEALVMTCFFSNSFENRPTALLIPFAVVSTLLSSWLRGRFWRYATLLGFEGVVALLVVLAFPIMEMILESIVEEKMRKVGEKIRAHDERMKRLLRRKREEQGRGGRS